VGSDFFPIGPQQLASAADLSGCVTPPRYNVPGQTVWVTVQAVGRSFRFVPTVQVRESIDFLFALLATKYGLEVHEFLFMSNHFHLVATDPRGVISDFLCEFDSMLSRQLNALRGTTGTNFEREPGILAIADSGGIIEKAIYTLCNPLVAHLVKHLREWKASSSFGLEYGESVTFARPKCGLWTETRRPERKGKHPSRWRLKYRGRSKAPETARLTLVRPKAMLELDDEELRRYIRDRVAEREEELIEERRRTKTQVVGWLGVIAQHYLAMPSTPRVLFQRRPRVAGSNPGACAILLETLERFVHAYRLALAAFKAGERSSVFPYGTLQMVRRYDVACATAPP
jgi:putative transposase